MNKIALTYNSIEKKGIKIGVLLGAFTFTVSVNAYAFSDIILNPSPQVTGSTCQSYSIAFAMAQNSAMHQHIETPKDLRKLERQLRKQIESIAQNSPGTAAHHEVWVEAVRQVSSNNLRLKLEYYNDPNKFYRQVKNLTNIDAAEILGGVMSATLMDKVVMTSVNHVNGNIYDGHVVSIIGVGKALPNHSIANWNTSLMILNSAVKTGSGETINMCSESISSGDKAYSANVSLTHNYELKHWSGDRLLMYIENN